MAAYLAEPKGSDNSITALLEQLSAGNRDVEAQLIPLVYGELRQLAGRYMRFERGDHTLQPTALVNEAYLRLVQQPQVPWQNRAHFFATAARVMRRILVDHARARLAEKRGGMQNEVELDEAMLPMQARTVDVLILDEALDRLERFDPRQARIIEHHFFGGLSLAETALVLDISERTAKRGWSMGRAWLRRELSRQP
jgi:RNA polymerase sigma factor (TIGR02999 family)